MKLETRFAGMYPLKPNTSSPRTGDGLLVQDMLEYASELSAISRQPGLIPGRPFLPLESPSHGVLRLSQLSAICEAGHPVVVHPSDPIEYRLSESEARSGTYNVWVGPTADLLPTGERIREAAQNGFNPSEYHRYERTRCELSLGSDALTDRFLAGRVRVEAIGRGCRTFVDHCFHPAIPSMAEYNAPNPFIALEERLRIELEGDDSLELRDRRAALASVATTGRPDLVFSLFVSLLVRLPESSEFCSRLRTLLLSPTLRFDPNSFGQFLGELTEAIKDPREGWTDFETLELAEEKYLYRSGLWSWDSQRSAWRWKPDRRDFRPYKLALHFRNAETSHLPSIRYDVEANGSFPHAEPVTDADCEGVAYRLQGPFNPCNELFCRSASAIGEKELDLWMQGNGCVVYYAA